MLEESKAVKESFKAAKQTLLKNLKICVTDLVPQLKQNDVSQSKSSLGSERFASLKRNDPKIKDL